MRIAAVADFAALGFQVPEILAGSDIHTLRQGIPQHVKVAGVHVTTNVWKIHKIRLELEAEEGPQDHLLEVSIGGKSPADLTEIALRGVLLGESNPLADRYMGFTTEISDPLAPLREDPVSEEIIRPLSELLLTDLLVGTRRAMRIVAFRLGVAIRGRRRLMLAWEAPNHYSNDPVTVRSISGEVTL